MTIYLRFHCNSLVSIVNPSSFHCRDMRSNDFAVEICWYQYYWFYCSLLCITWQLCVMTSHPGHFMSHVFAHNEIKISQSQTNCCYEQRALMRLVTETCLLCYLNFKATCLKATIVQLIYWPYWGLNPTRKLYIICYECTQTNFLVKIYQNYKIVALKFETCFSCK